VPLVTVKEHVPPLAAQFCDPETLDAPLVLVIEAVTVVAVCPLLLSVQEKVAAVGAVVGDWLLQPLSESAGGDGFTTRLTEMATAEPVLGVAVSVPL